MENHQFNSNFVIGTPTVTIHFREQVVGIRFIRRPNRNPELIIGQPQSTDAVERGSAFDEIVHGSSDAFRSRAEAVVALAQDRWDLFEKVKDRIYPNDTPFEDYARASKTASAAHDQFMEGCRQRAIAQNFGDTEADIAWGVHMAFFRTQFVGVSYSGNESLSALTPSTTKAVKSLKEYLPIIDR